MGSSPMGDLHGQIRCHEHPLWGVLIFAPVYLTPGTGGIGRTRRAPRPPSYSSLATRSRGGGEPRSTSASSRRARLTVGIRSGGAYFLSKGVDARQEIVQVARAFDQVHSEAVRLAGNEAMLRRSFNAMFVNLSRRSQSLIERQLSLIDSLEQSEQDSGRLSSLFRLDHLATRMRRNSENLLVLAGHEVTRRWSQPVPLVDVLRAAISEIEQYERVVLNVQPGIVVVGQAVNDVVHLVAEIVENATTFSPEDTQVYVSGQPLSSGGVLLDITDNGVGISDQEMSHANWRLDNPPVVDVAVARRMGLFVVGRRAARHGVRVRLRHAQAGGLTALIWLPDTVAAPEVAPSLGRLRRFEAEDFGPAPSLSAPTQVAGTGASATSAARAASRGPSATWPPLPRKTVPGSARRSIS